MEGICFAQHQGQPAALPCVRSPRGASSGTPARSWGVPEVLIHQEGLPSPEWGSLGSWLVPGTLWHELMWLPVSSGVLLRALTERR